VKTIASPGAAAEAFPVSEVSPINPRKMGQDFIASYSRSDAPRIAFIT
jgi:hypothetical protein